MAEAHSTYGASGFEAAMLCPGKPVMEAGLPDTSNAYSREGTAAHTLLEWCLTEDRTPDAYAGRIIEVEGDKFVVDEDMIDHVGWARAQIVDYAAGNLVLAETRVCYAEAIGVDPEQGWGTADVIIPRDDELIVIDLKYGRGVEVSAERNPQMMLYGLGALAHCDGILGEFKRVRLVVLQPRVSRRPSEWDCSVEELRQWAASEAWDAVERRQQAEGTSTQAATDGQWEEHFLTPGEKQCRFCKAKATCPALRNEVASTIVGVTPASPEEFGLVIDEEGARVAVGGLKDDTPDWLSLALSKVDLIEDWCKAVRAEAERRLLAGQSVPGWKLVPGKKGARQWVDAQDAEAMLKSMRLKLEEMYDLKLISPTSAEKLVKAEKIGPRQWTKLQSLITQSEGKPHVAPVSDPRPALEIRPVAEDFETLPDNLA